MSSPVSSGSGSSGCAPGARGNATTRSRDRARPLRDLCRVAGGSGSGPGSGAGLLYRPKTTDPVWSTAVTIKVVPSGPVSTVLTRWVPGPPPHPPRSTAKWSARFPARHGPRLLLRPGPRTPVLFFFVPAPEGRPSSPSSSSSLQPLPCPSRFAPEVRRRWQWAR